MPRRQTLRRRRFSGRKRSQSELEKELKSLLTEKSTKKQHKNKFQRVLEDLEKRSWFERNIYESTEKKNKKTRTKKQSKQLAADLKALREQIREVEAELEKAKKEGKKMKEVKALEQELTQWQSLLKWGYENPVTAGGGTLAAIAAIFLGGKGVSSLLTSKSARQHLESIAKREDYKFVRSVVVPPLLSNTAGVGGPLD